MEKQAALLRGFHSLFGGLSHTEGAGLSHTGGTGLSHTDFGVVEVS